MSFTVLINNRYFFLFFTNSDRNVNKIMKMCYCTHLLVSTKPPNIVMLRKTSETKKHELHQVVFIWTLAKCLYRFRMLIIFHDGIFVHFQKHVNWIFFGFFFRLEQQQSEKSEKFYFLSLDCSIDTFNDDDGDDDYYATTNMYTCTIDFLDLPAVQSYFRLEREFIYRYVFNENWR